MEVVGLPGGGQSVLETPFVLQQAAGSFQQYFQTPIVAAKVDNVLKDLQSEVTEYETIEFVDRTMEDGFKVYQRSVVYLMIVAVRELFVDAEITVEHSISGGLYCEMHMERPLEEDDVRAIEKRMRRIVDEDRAVTRCAWPRRKVVRLFKENGQLAKAKLVSSLERDLVSIYECGGFYDYLYGPMIPSTGSLGLFALDYAAPGLVVRVPTVADPTKVPPFVAQEKLSEIFAEAEQWARILECPYVVSLNYHNRTNAIRDLIRVSEALHEKKIAQIADYIASNTEQIRLVLVAGPSSSGKTTFAQRLAIQMRVNGVRPLSLSLDDYFLDRARTPKDAQGNYDFESLEALDVALFNEHLIRLFKGERVEIPSYNFVTGEREMRGNFLQLDENQPLIVEGIHGLNEALTRLIPRAVKYKVYVSALTQLAIDGHNRIPTTDARLFRRMVRDHRTRGSYALRSIRQWPKVRAGEEKNIFPYQEEADAMFNTSLIYELGVLKKYAKPLLKEVDASLPEYAEATRLLGFLAYFDDIVAEDEVPRNSILREFIGGSCFSVG